MFRNYLCFGGIGQGQRQIDTLEDVGVVLGNENDRFWVMRNGYALPATSTSMAELGSKMKNSSPELSKAAEDALRVGVHWETQVKPPLTHRVTQVYASAVPVAYSNTRASDWAPFARLVLRGAYRATMAVACCKATLQPGQRVSVYLTSLGGGAFGNRKQWIREAVSIALEEFQDMPLDVYLVHYGTRVPSDWASELPRRGSKSKVEIFPNGPPLSIASCCRISFWLLMLLQVCAVGPSLDMEKEDGTSSPESDE